MTGAAAESEAEVELGWLCLLLSLQKVPTKVKLAIEGTNSTAAAVATADSNLE